MKRLFSVIMALATAALCLVHASAASDIPTSYSSVDKGYITSVKTQGKTTSCWAFAAIACLEADSIKQGYTTLNNTDFSEAYLVWSCFNSANGTSGDYKLSAADGMYRTAGNAYEVLVSLARGTGLNNESDYPFYSYNASKMGNYPKSALNSSNGLYLGECAYLYKTDDIKAWVMDHGAVAIYYNSDGTYQKNSDGSYSYITDENPNASFHMGTVVGWDDNYSRNNFSAVPEHNGAWLIKGSWGSSFGNNGYYWISYDNPQEELYTGFSVTDEEPGTVYTHSEAGYSSMIGLTSEHTMQANVFDIEEGQNIDNVSFFTKGSTKATIAIYKLNDNYDTPVQGELLYAQSEYLEYGGYHVIHLVGLTVEGNNKYSVVINLFGQGGTCAVYLENLDDTAYHYSYAEKESYYNLGNEWYETSRCHAGNVCINLYTSGVASSSSQPSGKVTDTSSSGYSSSASSVNTPITATGSGDTADAADDSALNTSDGLNDAFGILLSALSKTLYFLTALLNMFSSIAAY